MKLDGNVNFAGLQGVAAFFNGAKNGIDRAMKGIAEVVESRVKFELGEDIALTMDEAAEVDIGSDVREEHTDGTKGDDVAADELDLGRRKERWHLGAMQQPVFGLVTRVVRDIFLVKADGLGQFNKKDAGAATQPE